MGGHHAGGIFGVLGHFPRHYHRQSASPLHHPHHALRLHRYHGKKYKAPRHRLCSCRPRLPYQRTGRPRTPGHSFGALVPFYEITENHSSSISLARTSGLLRYRPSLVWRHVPHPWQRFRQRIPGTSQCAPRHILGASGGQPFLLLPPAAPGHDASLVLPLVL